MLQFDYALWFLTGEAEYEDVPDPTPPPPPPTTEDVPLAP